MVFDKTGTLTANKPEVVQVQSFDPTLNETIFCALRLWQTDALRIRWPKAVFEGATRRSIQVPEPQTFEQLQARGVKATVDGKIVLVGNPALLLKPG